MLGGKTRSNRDHAPLDINRNYHKQVYYCLFRFVNFLLNFLAFSSSLFYIYTDVSSKNMNTLIIEK